jgi:hypothetical protein
MAHRIDSARKSIDVHFSREGQNDVLIHRKELTRHVRPRTVNEKPTGRVQVSLGVCCMYADVGEARSTFESDHYVSLNLKRKLNST